MGPEHPRPPCPVTTWGPDDPPTHRVSFLHRRPNDPATTGPGNRMGRPKEPTSRRRAPPVQLALGGVERPRRVVRFVRLMHRPVRAFGPAYGRRRLRWWPLNVAVRAPWLSEP